MRLLCLLLPGLLLSSACLPTSPARVQRTEARAPARGEGCAVSVATSEPPGVRELGRITVTCGADAEASCERVLRQEACALGADVVWDKQDSSKVRGRSKLTARAGLLASGGP